jgi:hypothetical protein
METYGQKNVRGQETRAQHNDHFSHGIASRILT